MKEVLSHQELSSLGIIDLADQVKESRYQNRRCLEYFLERSQEESIRDPRAALPLMFEAPEFVNRCCKYLEDDYETYLVRGIGVLATGLTQLGSYEMAAKAFDLSRNVECSDEFEIAALDCRQAVFEACRQNWNASFALAERAVAGFADDTGSSRDDRSQATALMVRAVVRLTAYRHGVETDLEQVAADYQQCLAIASQDLRRTRLSAVIGLGAVSVSIWFTGKPTRVAPSSVVGSLIQFRKDLRRDGIPLKSIIDSKSRWVLGLAIRQLVGGLSPVAEAHLRDALSVLRKIGAAKDVAELVLELQWCLVSEGRWAKAIEDWKIVEDLLDQVPTTWRVTLVLWSECLRRRKLTEEVTRSVFWEVRGIRDATLARLTVPDDIQDDELIGW